MPADRDPRIDPRPGDVLRYSGNFVVLVFLTREGRVFYRDVDHETDSVPLNWWSDLNKNAEVIHRAD